MSLIAITDVKPGLGIDDTDTSEDIALGQWCTRADAAIKRYCKRDLELTTYPATATYGRGDSGIYSGDGSRYLILRQKPVISVTSVNLDMRAYWASAVTPFDTTTLLVSGTDYALATAGYIGSAAVSNRGIIERINGVWPQSWWYRRGNIVLDPQTAQGNIKVIYQAGFATIPPDIVQAGALLVAYWRRIAQAGGNLQSESLGNYSYSLAGPMKGAGLPDDVRKLLSPYRERVV